MQSKNTGNSKMESESQPKPYNLTKMVLVTGASGFIGRHVIDELLRLSYKVQFTFRTGSHARLHVEGVDAIGLSGLGVDASDWAGAVERCSAVIHLAARAHVRSGYHEVSAQSLRSANIEYACACCEAAVRAGVGRFVFLSSVGVHGGGSGTEPIHADSPIAPHTLYAHSKADAELALANIVRGSNTGLTVIRPPLVYGLGAPGNFGALMRAVAHGWPLPLGLVSGNYRSLVSIDNLVNLIVACLEHPAAVNQTFLVSDGEDISTADLLRRLSAVMKRPARLLPVPLGVLAFGAKLLGKTDMFQSLCGSLRVDITKTRDLLGWAPPIDLDEGLRRAVQGLHR